MFGRGSSAQAAPALIALVAALAATATGAAADQPQSDIALTLNPIFGTHQSFNDRTRPAPVPVPIFELRHSAGPFELSADGLPPIASARSKNSVQGRTSTRLTIFETTLRVFDPLRRYSFGIGETIYNQATHYADAVEIPGTGDTQFSRVVGAHYELGYRVPYARGRMEVSVRYAPVMRGTQYTMYDVATNRTRADPERADQIDVQARYVRKLTARRDLILGIRYVNYTARYDERQGTLSDRNAGVLPSVGLRWRAGR